MNFRPGARSGSRIPEKWTLVGLDMREVHGVYLLLPVSWEGTLEGSWEGTLGWGVPYLRSAHFLAREELIN